MNNMNRMKKWRWINLAAFICMMIINVMAEALPIGGMTTGEISALYPSPITPAPVTFGIWGLIYLYLAVFMLMQFAAEGLLNVTERLGPWFLVSCVANICWLLTWHLQAMTVSMLMMVVLLAALIMLERRLLEMDETTGQRWLIRAPFSIYYGWITVATIANVSVWLAALGFNGFGLPSQLWQTVVLLTGAVILYAGIWKNRDVPYGLAGLWGYVGILMKQLMTGEGGIWSLTALVISCAAIIFAMLSVCFADADGKRRAMKRAGTDAKPVDIEGGLSHEA